MEAYKDLNFVIYLRFLAKLFQSQAWVDAESWIYMWKATSSIMKTEFSFFNASEHIITSPM